MGIFDVLKKKSNMVTEKEKNIVHLPVEGEVISLEDIGDGVFSAGILGKGFGIRPHKEAVYAPLSGEVILIADTKHAIGLRGKTGVEVMIHVGMDTVAMNGKGFDVKVAVGDQVDMGQLLFEFSIEEIERAGYPTVTAVLVTNTNEYSDVVLLNRGQQKVGEQVLQILA